MFLHPENQQLLAALLQKSPFYLEFVKLYPHQQQGDLMRNFCKEWNRPMPQTPSELLQINKEYLQFVLADVRRLVSYEAPSPTMTYNIAMERQQREEQRAAEFEQYERNYEKMLARPAVPTMGIPQELPEEKIRNMDELMLRQQKLREMDVAFHAPPPLIPPQQRQAPGGPPRLKIMDSIEQAEIEQSVLSVRQHRSSSKSVSWEDTPVAESNDHEDASDFISPQMDASIYMYA